MNIHFRLSALPQNSPISLPFAGREYNKLKDKHILHLALLLHDLGKGYPGRSLRSWPANRTENWQAVAFESRTVRRHQVSRAQSSRDDPSRFSPGYQRRRNDRGICLQRRLRPDAYPVVSADVRGCRCGRTGRVDALEVQSSDQPVPEDSGRILTGDEKVELGGAEEKMYAEISQHGKTPEMSDWINSASRNLPRNYCQQHESEEVARQLVLLRNTVGDQVQTWIKKCTGSELFELCIGKRESRRSGILYRMLGMLASQGAGVRSADIKSLGNSIVFYWFRFVDHEFDDPPASRLEDLRLRAIDLVTGKDDGPPSFSKRWSNADSVARKLSRPKIEVKIDNQTVESATIIDVFAYRKMGLLYRVAKKVHQLGLDVKFARISTYAQQMIAVLYVTDEQGSKVRNKNQLQMIKQELYRTTKDYLEPDTRSEI